MTLPPALSELLKLLGEHQITPILVGGCVRDHLLGRPSSDFDIELYGLSSPALLHELTRPWGSLNEVGKHFGVFKLSLGSLSIDFSLPRTESKTGERHQDFEITTYTEIDFATAARRRDFTINAIGYNPLLNIFLDPYNGQSDLQNKRLKCVDPDTFVEDPLRVLRAVQFTSRFHLTCDPNLLVLCHTMIVEGALEKLPHERIFEEIKKLLLSPKPSVGLDLLEQMGGRCLFDPADDKSWKKSLDEVDKVAAIQRTDEKETLSLMLAALLLEAKHPREILQRLTHERRILSLTLNILEHTRRYHVLRIPPDPILMGRDLIALGLPPSPDFKILLSEAYDAQLNSLFSTKSEAFLWLNNRLGNTLVTRV